MFLYRLQLIRIRCFPYTKLNVNYKSYEIFILLPIQSQRLIDKIIVRLEAANRYNAEIDIKKTCCLSRYYYIKLLKSCVNTKLFNLEYTVFYAVFVQ